MIGGVFLASSDIIIIVMAVVAVIAGALFFLNRWVSKKSVEQRSVIEKTKQQASIFVIDKTHDKAQNVTLPKSVTENMPKATKLMKMYFVKAKVGPQIVTLMCDKKAFLALEPKKTYKVDLAGMYIVSVKGMKSEKELKELAKTKKLKEKEEKKRNNGNVK